MNANDLFKSNDLFKNINNSAKKEIFKIAPWLEDFPNIENRTVKEIGDIIAKTNKQNKLEKNKDKINEIDKK